MRNAPYITSTWQQGGALVGARAPHTRVTVEPAWRLNQAYDVAVADPSRLPYHWWIRANGSRVEVEVPNVKEVSYDFSIDAHANTCTVTILNSNTGPIGSTAARRRLGDAGHYTPYRGGPEADARWGVRNRAWQGILVEGALIRVYQGFGGREKGIAQALNDGNIILKGVFVVDTVNPNSSGDMTLNCRDMAGALLIDQTLFPPLVPQAWYPPSFERWTYTETTWPAVKEYDSTNPTNQGQGGEGPKWIPDIAIAPDGQGYYLVGTDGGIFAFGSAAFFGSRGSEPDNSPIRSITVAPSGRGYWIVGEDGGVHAFGDVGYYGGPIDSAPLNNIIMRIRSTPTGRGYWCVDFKGAVFAYGDAGYFGGQNVSDWITDFQPTPSGQGYYMVSILGAVYCHGDAVYLGGPNPLSGGDHAAGIAIRPQNDGYWITTGDGDIISYGAASEHSGDGQWSVKKTLLSDPIKGIAASPTGSGYVLAGGDGGVFAFGDVGFAGSLPADYTTRSRWDGNYRDLSDIVKQILLWSGFLLYTPGGQAEVYGAIQTTNTYSDDRIGAEAFMNKSPMDAINAIKEQVGYIFYIDGEGAAHFEEPNWWRPGNILEDGSRTQFMPELDERNNLFSHSPTRSIEPVRNEIIVSNSNKPLASREGLLTTRYVPPNAGALRGRVRPGLRVNGLLTTKQDQEVTARLIAMHLWFKQKTGNSECILNPALEPNDQVWIFEEVTGEMALHYVRGITGRHNLETGEFTMSVKTNQLGFWPNWWTQDA